MIIIKKNYYLYIENIKDLNILSLKNNNKINIILRNIKNNEIKEIIKFRKKCKNKKLNFILQIILKLLKNVKLMVYIFQLIIKKNILLILIKLDLLII